MFCANVNIIREMTEVHEGMNESWQGMIKIPIDHCMIAPTFPVIVWMASVPISFLGDKFCEALDRLVQTPGDVRTTIFHNKFGDTRGQSDFRSIICPAGRVPCKHDVTPTRSILWQRKPTPSRTRGSQRIGWLSLDLHITKCNRNGQILMVPMCRLSSKHQCKTFLSIARRVLCKRDVCRFCIWQVHNFRDAMSNNILPDVKCKVHLDCIIPHSRQSWAYISNIANKPLNTRRQLCYPTALSRWLLHPLMPLQQARTNMNPICDVLWTLKLRQWWWYILHCLRLRIRHHSIILFPHCQLLLSKKGLNKLYRLTSCKNFLKESLGTRPRRPPK